MMIVGNLEEICLDFSGRFGAFLKPASTGCQEATVVSVSNAVPRQSTAFSTHSQFVARPSNGPNKEKSLSVEKG